MDTREIKAFLVLADNLNYTISATQCSMSTSALSRTIMRLENELSTTLFTRDNKTVNLTEAGKTFKSFAEQFNSKFEAIKQELKTIDQPLSGKIRLYCSVTASLFLLPQLLNKFRFLYPNIEIKIETGDAAVAIQKLKSNNADLSIAAVSKTVPKDIFTIELAKIPLVFIAPKQIPQNWYSDNNVDWLTVPYIISEQGELRKELKLWFHRNHINKPYIYAEVAGNEAIVSMVALGLGVALIPQAVVEQSSLGAAVQILLSPLDIAPFNVSLCVTPQSLKQNHIKAFINMVETKI